MKRPAVPWWNKTCYTLRKITRKCFRRYEVSGSSIAKVTYLRNQAKQRKYFKKAKRQSWIYFINGISSKTPERKVWNRIRKLCGKHVPNPMPTLKIGDSIITEPEQVAEKLGEHFAAVSDPSQYSPQFQNIRNSKIHIEVTQNDDQPYNMNFTLRELEYALSTTESTSPGEDNILYEMIKHLPQHAKISLLKIINKIWVTGILPAEWKISLIIPAKKPNKDPNEATSYRPIALTSNIRKLMEKMINTRLVWYLEKNKCLSPVQYGFRKNRSTLDPLLRFSNHMQQGYVAHKRLEYSLTWKKPMKGHAEQLF